MLETDLVAQDRFINRELSWIDFNARVLALAEDESTPLLERAKFLAVFATNLDEFYMVRVAGLKQQIAAKLSTRSPQGMTPRDQIAEISVKVRPLVERHAQIFCDELMPALAKEGIEVLRLRDVDARGRRELDGMFRDHIFPVLTPLAVDPGHPFPYISNLSLNLAVQVRDRRDGDGKTHFARVKVPPVLPRFVSLSAAGAFVPLEDVIAAHLDRLFPGMEIVEHHDFRVTRNADLDVDDDGAEDLLVLLEEQLAKRRFSPAVRLEAESSMPPHVLALLMRELEVDEAAVHRLPGPLDLAGLWALHAIDRPDLKDDAFRPSPHRAMTEHDDGATDVFAVLRRKDLLVHHPYDSFASTVERFIEQAAADPDVLAIKQTLYRTSGDSPIVQALTEAAEAGKQVVVVVEIKARFDERANIGWARTLEKAGCHVVYGLLGLKTHAKLCLVVRQEDEGLNRYIHVGTGNYNPRTARIYEDLGLLTSSERIAGEVNHLFNYLTGYSLRPDYRSLIAAPQGMRERLIGLIQREADRSSEESRGRIAMKINSLVDESVIDALYSASQAGVDVDLLVRGICCLRPGIEGLSNNIRVHGILGRFLEHSRIFYFHNGGEHELFIGSADLMQRNLDRRVEVLVQVESSALRKELVDLLALGLADNTSAWRLEGDGAWTKLEPDTEEDAINLQEELMRRSREHE
ncbi:RNA degradosome polyphosphate kinase [soil metagenome]